MVGSKLSTWIPGAMYLVRFTEDGLNMTFPDSDEGPDAENRKRAQFISQDLGGMNGSCSQLAVGMSVIMRVLPRMLFICTLLY